VTGIRRTVTGIRRTVTGIRRTVTGIRRTVTGIRSRGAWDCVKFREPVERLETGSLWLAYYA
jgi:hypothetical protein